MKLFKHNLMNYYPTKLRLVGTGVIVIFITTLLSFQSKTNNDIASIKISTQLWATKNLDISTFRNGDTIPEIESQDEFYHAGLNGKPAWCYYNGDPANGKKYGKLYNWYAVVDSRDLAPQGWHIPTDEEWTILTTYLGGDTIAGKKMKSAKEWDGNNSSGFNALPAGFSCPLPSNSLGMVAYFWAATEYSSRAAWGRHLDIGIAQSGRGANSKSIGNSVRCLKD